MWTSLREKLLEAIILGRGAPCWTSPPGIPQDSHSEDSRERGLLVSGRGRLIFYEIQLEISPYQRPILKQKDFTRTLSQTGEVPPFYLTSVCVSPKKEKAIQLEKCLSNHRPEIQNL